MSKTIQDFHGDDVWRDEEGTVWVRLEQLITAVASAVDPNIEEQSK